MRPSFLYHKLFDEIKKERSLLYKSVFTNDKNLDLIYKKTMPK
jgi:hypothetical protein